MNLSNVRLNTDFLSQLTHKFIPVATRNAYDLFLNNYQVIFKEFESTYFMYTKLCT